MDFNFQNLPIFAPLKFYKMSLRNAYLIVFIILLVDQLSKIYIKTNFVYGEIGQNRCYQLVQNPIDRKRRDGMGNSDSRYLWEIVSYCF